MATCIYHSKKKIDLNSAQVSEVHKPQSFENATQMQSSKWAHTLFM